jgi:hypothetical protein
MIHKLKKKSKRQIFLEMNCNKHLMQELVNINKSSLSDPKFYKLRSDLFRIIGTSYLDDNFDHYVSNTHKIFQMLLANNMIGNQMDVNIVRLFYDIIGIMNSMTLNNIFIVFIKISYERIQIIIEEHGAKYLGDEQFIVALLKFYTIMCENCFSKLQRDSNVIFFKVINDSFCLLTSLIAECNNSLKAIDNVENLKSFVSDKSEMLF